ncbi:TIGR03067 domain-containing protein [Frigoriglobus tundricola]|uniref:TIGR03067 domain-containing protein n=1 Tax=Frigoriglobus tundricola TaxID=2774151 RepID=A0A6M5YYC1_9BACT|nr:TIGR03067 domain-containing protein [Frigoriglobus tundricola]QJW99117.1 hypothetical protein FTUN_6715 [Frigoriglobus tundricola]
MLAALVALSIGYSADPPNEKEKELPEAAQKQLQKLQGKWKVVKLCAKGMEYQPAEGDRDLIAEFKGRKFSFTGVEKGEVVAIDSLADPKCLDMKCLEKGRTGVVDEGIFKLDGDTLTICFYQGEGKNRPTSFDAPKEPGTVMAVFKRVATEAKK